MPDFRDLPDATGLDERRKLVQRTRELWERSAAAWDDRAGGVNDFHRQLVTPTVDGLLGPSPGERVLEVACGNGAFARHLANLGARVVATDFSETFIARARKQSQQPGHHLAFEVVDATDERALLALGRHGFDAIVCNMSLPDMPVIDPLFRAIPKLLKPAGRFVFTVPHPCFNHAASLLVASEGASASEASPEISLTIDNYLDIPESRSQALVASTARPITFHRPLSEILNAAFNAGLLMDGVAEPAYPASRPGRAPSWASLPSIPPVFAARFRTARDFDR